MKNNINILIACVIILSILTITTADDNGINVSVKEPGFKILKNPGTGATEPATQRIFIGFHNAPGDKERMLVQGLNGKIIQEFPEVQAFAVEIPTNQINALSKKQDVLYFEPDPIRYPLGLSDSELEPSISNGLYGLITTNATTVQLKGVTGTGSIACIADTAIDTTHPDISPNLLETHNFNSQPIDLPNETHATHVAGTVVAALNGKGVRGVAYTAKLYHARVLGPDGGYSSEVMSGVKWLVENKSCKVVGLSLGGSSKSLIEENFYKLMYSKGALIIAATGNDNATELSFPAGYPVVVSVGALDRNNSHASFSNTGNNLDISAPGVDILSSVPIGTGSESSVITGSSSHPAFGMTFAGKTSGINGTIINSGTGNNASEFPSSVKGNISLMRRGSITFAAKVDNAMKAGAVAAIIYNNVAGGFEGTLSSPSNSSGNPWIPVVSVSDSTGATLAAMAGTTGTVVNQISDWDYFSGTSMATPHVVGVAALVMSANPALTNNQVEMILKNTANDLGEPGYDTTFGFGLVNASRAIEAANITYGFITKWGSPGSSDGQFFNPSGVDVDSSGNVYVADTFNNRIQKFSGSGGFIAKWGSEGTGDGQFQYPSGVDVDNSGNVYVADTFNNRIQKFNDSGEFISKWGINGTDDGQFSSPSGIALDNSGNVYVVDSGNNRIQKFNNSGKFIVKWGSEGTGDGQFNSPSGIALDNSGNVYVADTFNNRFQMFNASGGFLAKWGSNDTGDGQFSSPSGIALDNNGNVYVADTSNNRIQKFNASGGFIVKWGSEGTGDGQFNSPSGIAVDSSGDVYVVDTSNNRIQKFRSSTTKILNGDANRNGIRDTGDATLIMRYLVKLPTPPDYLPILPIGDMNCNTILDTGDATLILRDIVGLDITRCWE
ncbi:MAG: S8 family serine peptidase [Candidatus Methanoperedens sp.]|nr:S8 family serine peptidase [Candidatus Methanoperedens sp.]